MEGEAMVMPGTVLVVEDELKLRDLLRSYLERRELKALRWRAEPPPT
jgi:hypothetical protein